MLAHQHGQALMGYFLTTYLLQYVKSKNSLLKFKGKSYEAYDRCTVSTWIKRLSQASPK